MAVSGSQSTAALTSGTQYTLTCTGAGGSAAQSVTVSVSAPPTSTATLSWTAPTENTNGTPVTTLAGYTIQYGTSESALSQTVSINSPSTLSYTITGLTPGTWYFAVVAVAADGTQSALSGIVSKAF